MNLRNWISVNNEELINITNHITSFSEDSMELYQHVVLQLLEKPDKIDNLSDDEKRYYFIKVLKNNYHSKTSPFRYQELKYKKNNILTEDFSFNENLPEDELEDLPDLNWVKETLDTFDWFDRDLFLLWLEVGTLINVHKETTIPINSVGKYIRDIKKRLRDLWINR